MPVDISTINRFYSAMAISDLSERTASKTSLVYRRLRSDVLSGRLAPGERLKIAELAAALEVNAAAVREALQRLVPEQLVVSRDQRGFTVARLSVADLRELTELRISTETLALQRAIERGDDAWEGRILAAAHRLRRTAMLLVSRDVFSSEWAQRHAEFHFELVSACGNRRLLQLHAQLYEQSERYRALSLRLSARGDRDVEAEHQALADAVLERDAAQATALIRDHFQRTTDSIIAAAEHGWLDLP